MEIPKAIDKLRIVGSGTAGLIFATYFKKMVPDMEIEIYYDSKIKPLVVGESMQPYMRFFFEKVFEDESWMDKTNATYKFYIKHDGNLVDVAENTSLSHSSILSNLSSHSGNDIELSLEAQPSCLI